MLQGIDISSYQSSSPNLAGLGFVFIKVTEGLSYVNPKWVAQRADARAAGLVTGFYHYPKISNGGTVEADRFLSQINLQPGDILCLDWEWYGQTVSNQVARDYKDAFVARVRQKAPSHRIVVYSNVSDWVNVDTDSNCGDGLWVADYVTAGQPRVKHPWVFHQYTDAAPQGGDGDVANPAMFPNAAALRAWALGSAPAPSPAPKPVPSPTPQESDMPQWFTGPVVPAAQPTVVLVPRGNAWTAAQHRTLHLGMDHVGDPAAKATVRVAVHDGKTWGQVITQTVTAAGGTVDVDVTGAAKVSLETDAAGVSYAVESW